MDDDVERMAGRTRTESAELRRRDLQRRSLPWRHRIFEMLFNRWTWIIPALMVVALLLLMTVERKP